MPKSNHVQMISPDGKPWQCPANYVERAKENGFHLPDEEPSDQAAPNAGFDGFNGDDFGSPAVDD